MTREPVTQRVDVTFVGVPPVRQIERASGVSEVEVDGHVLRCLVCGSFQPFLEALAVTRWWTSGPHLSRIGRREPRREMPE